MDEKKKAFEGKNIRSILVSASLALAIISSYTTAKGLHEYVFDIWWQAMLVSVAVQSGLFVLNLKLYEFVKKTTWVWVLWIVLIGVSSSFSYVYISQSVYSESLYVEDADRSLTEEFIEYFDDLSKYMEAYELYLLQNMEGFISIKIGEETQNLTEEIKKEVEAIHRLGDEIQFPEWGDAKNDTAERILAESNAVLLGLKQLNTEKKDEILDALALAQRNIELRIAEVDKNYAISETVLNEERERLEIGNFNTSSETYAKMNVANLEREQELKKYEALRAALNFKLELIKDQVERVNKIESYQIDDSLSNIQKEILNAMPDISVLNKNIEPLKEIFLKEDKQNTISDLKNFIRTVEKYGEVQSMKVVLDDLFDKMNDVITTSGEEVEGNGEVSAFTNEDLRNKWLGILKGLKEFIIHLPEKQELSISGSDADTVEKNYDAIPTIKRADKVNELSALERRYFGELNDFERAANLLSSKYRLMAWFSLCFAIALDAIGALLGVFIYKYENNEERIKKHRCKLFRRR